MPHEQSIILIDRIRTFFNRLMYKLLINKQDLTSNCPFACLRFIKNGLHIYWISFICEVWSSLYTAFTIH